jgi:hypothetical protein
MSFTTNLLDVLVATGTADIAACSQVRVAAGRERPNPRLAGSSSSTWIEVFFCIGIAMFS